MQPPFDGASSENGLRQRAPELSGAEIVVDSGGVVIRCRI